MKTQNLVLPKSTSVARPSLKAWFNRENRLFSKIWEERVTNKQVLITFNLTFSFVPLMAFSFEEILPALVAVSYFAFSVYLCRAVVSKSSLQ